MNFSIRKTILAVLGLFFVTAGFVSAASTLGTNFSTDGNLTAHGNIVLGNATSDTITIQGDTTYTTSGSANFIINATSSTLSQAAAFEVNNTSATALNSAQVISHTALSGSPSGDGNLQSGLIINATQADADASLTGIFVNDLFGSAGSGTEVAIFQSGTAWDYGLFTSDAVLHSLPANGTVAMSGPPGGLSTVADGTIDIAVNSATGNNRGLQVRYGKTGAGASGTQAGLRVYTEQGSGVTGTLYGMRIESLGQSNGQGGQLSGATEHALSIGANWDVGIDGTNVNTAGASANFIQYAGTTGVMDGSDSFKVISADVVSANHTGSNNTITGLNLGLTSPDAEASEKAINIYNAWDQAIVIDAETIDSTLVGGAGIIDLRADFGTTVSGATQYGMFVSVEPKDDANANQYFTGQVLTFLNSSEDAGDETRVLQLTNENNTSGTAVATDAMLVIENYDATANSVGDGIKFVGTTTSPIFSNGINFDNADFNLEIILENGEAIINQTDGTVTIEDESGNDLLTIVDTSNAGDVTATGFVSADAFRVVNGSALSATNPQLTKANLQQASHWSVSTASNAVDVDLGSDAVLDAGDVGRVIRFAVTTGHGTQALTVTTGTAITVTTLAATTGTTTEDAGDFIECLIAATNAATCVTYAAD